MPSLKHTLSLTAVGLLCVLAIALEGAAGYVYFLDELYPATPPRASEAITAPHPGLAERLVLVIVDAGREDLLGDPAIMPELERIARDGGRRGIAITQPITMTLLSVLNLGTGRTPGVSWSVQNFEAEPFPDESLFFWAHARGLGVAFAGDAAWSQLFGAYATLQNTFDDSGFYAAFEGALTVKDRKSIATAEQALAAPRDYPVVVLHLTSTDKVSHRDGALPRDASGALTSYALTAQATDAVIGDLHRRFARPDDLWLITSDHGATDEGYHGGGEVEARRAPFVIAGAGVREGPPVEIALNAWAPTLAVALGLPIPRTAERPAAFDLLAISPPEQRAILRAHAARRVDFVGGVVDALGADLDTTRPLEDALEDAPEQAIAASQRSLSEIRAERRWLYLLGGGIGLALHIIGFALLWRRTRPAPSDRRRWRSVAPLLVLWATLASLLLVYDGWLFFLFDHLSAAFTGPLELGRALLWLVGLSVVLLLAPRALSERSEEAAGVLILLLFGVAVIASSQVAIQWPYGDIAEGFRGVFIWGALLAGWWLRRRPGRVALWALGAAGVALIVGLRAAVGGGHLQTLPESITTAVAALAATLSVLALAAWRAWEAEPRAGDRAVALALLALLAAVTTAYRLLPEPAVARVALPTLALALVALMSGRLKRVTRRDLLFAWALGLAHVMTNDIVTLMTVGLLALALVLAELRWPERPWLPVAIGGLIGALDVAFFFSLGYRYSATSMDVHVVFMLDREGIDLVAGFLLLSLQHAPSWFMLWTASLYNRLEAGDTRGIATLFLAVLTVFVIRTWGPFFALSFRADNFWFSSHAVPMFVMSLTACFIATITFAASLSVLRRDAPRAGGAS